MLRCTATHKTVYAFLLNTITLIHYSYFAEDSDFYTVVADSLQQLHLFAALVCALLSALCSVFCAVLRGRRGEGQGLQCKM